MNKIITTILMLGAVSFAFAQSAENSLLFANQNYYGTARSSAMGGAFSSLGGDISVAHSNPAGLAIFRHSTFAITPAIYSSTVSGDGKSGDKTKFILPSLGTVLYSYGGETGVKNINFGLTYTQGANFNTKEHFEHLKSKYSLLQDIAYNASFDGYGNLKPFKEEELDNYYKYTDIGFAEGMAYKSYLISKTGANGEYEPVTQTDLVNRFEDITTKGSSGEFALSVAGNYEDKLYFGATLGIQGVNYKRNNNYDEQVANENAQTPLDYFYYDKFLKTQGTGVNLKLGLIYRPTDLLRLGVAVHTPTFYSLEDNYFFSMESKFIREPEQEAGTEFKETYPLKGETGVFEYNYRTPWKFTLGGSYIVPKIGLLSIDYELTDYSSAKFSTNEGEDFSEVNQTIKDLYKMTGTLKIGTEVLLNKQFSLRGGYNYFGNPYDKETGREQKSSLYSAGIGYRYKSIFIDASYQYYTQKNSITGKDFSYSRNMDRNTVKLTIGCKF